MTNRNWTKARLERDLDELHHLLDRARRESCGRPDDIVAQRLLKQLIQRRRAQMLAFLPTQPPPSAATRPKAKAPFREV